MKYLNELETGKEVDRRINALLESITKFFEEKSISLNFGKIRELLRYTHQNKKMDTRRRYTYDNRAF